MERYNNIRIKNYYIIPIWKYRQQKISDSNWNLMGAAISVIIWFLTGLSMIESKNAMVYYPLLIVF